MTILLVLAGLTGIIAFTVKGLIATFKKNGKAKKNFLLSAASFVLIIVAVATLPTPEKAAETKAEPKQAQAAAVKEEPKAEAEKVSEPEKAPEPEKVAEPEKPQITVSQKNAINKAEDYIAYTAFSKSGLVKQLEYEGFTNAEATFAVDNITVDYMEQSAKKAKDYMDYSSFSRSGLIQQLEYEGYTREQAEHGANEVGL